MMHFWGCDLKKSWILSIGVFQIAVFSGAYFLLNQNDESQDLFFDEPISSEKVQEPKQNNEAKAPFEHFVLAQGVVIPSSDYVTVEPITSGHIKCICKKVGEYVQKGDILYEIDDAQLQSKLLEKRALVLSASAKLDEVSRGAEPLEIRVKEKEVERAKLELSQKQKESTLFDELFEKNAVSEAEKSEQHSQLKMQEVEFDKIKTSLDLLMVGTSSSTKKVYEALLQEKMAQMQLVAQEIQGCAVKAPISGIVLECQHNEGQIAKPIVMGKTDPLFLRVLVDEKDAWRLLPNSGLRAVAVAKSNSNLQFVLNFQRISPLLKKYDSGTAKLELLFSFEKHHNPVYLEQNFNVFIQAVSQDDTACLEYQFQSLGK
jgi:multidrug efflux pump subunit AcrA (membrane-fusion protein)